MSTHSAIMPRQPSATIQGKTKARIVRPFAVARALPARSREGTLKKAEAKRAQPVERSTRKISRRKAGIVSRSEM